MPKKCQICGAKKENLATHISLSKDHPSLDEYKEIFGEKRSSYISKNVKKKISKSLQGHEPTMGMKGKKHSKETKEKISMSISGEKHPLYGKPHPAPPKGENHPLYGVTGKDHPRYGKKHSKETRDKISEAHKGKKLKEKTKKKITASLKNINLSQRTKKAMNRPEVKKKLKKPKSEEFKRKISEARKGKKASSETKEKMSKSLSGKGNPNWRGGKSYEEYGPEWNETLRSRVRERDNHKCKMCGLNQREHKAMFRKRLAVHHVNDNKRDNKLSNLLTLCIPCHLGVAHG